MLRKLIIATAAVAALTGSASAADMAVRSNVTKAPAYMPVFSWTGFYAGLNAGYGWARFDDATGLSSRPRGFVGGGQLGYNWQTGNIVFGLETDFQGADQRESATGVLPGFGATTVTERLRYFGTVRGRVGYAWDRWMAYFTGGYAYQNVALDVATAAFGAGSANTTKSGYTLGGGVEWAFWDRWSAKLEYLYLDTGNQNFTLGGGTFGGRVRNNVVRVGVNYHF